MQCSFCGNPEHLASYLFTPDNKLGSSTPITSALICERCVRGLYKQYMALLTKKAAAGKNATIPEK